MPVYHSNTNRPEDDGTWIVEGTCRKPKYTITGIAGKQGFVAITIEKAMMNQEIGFGRRVLQCFEEEGLSFEHMPSGIDTLTVVVSTDDFVQVEQQVLAGLHRAVNPDHQDEFEQHEQSIISKLHRSVEPDDIEFESDLALIAVVGRGMKQTRGTAGRLFSALSHARVNVKMIDQGSSELNIIIGVRNHDFEIAINAIYDIFVKTQF